MFVHGMSRVLMNFRNLLKHLFASAALAGRSDCGGGGAPLTDTGLKG